MRNFIKKLLNLIVIFAMLIQLFAVNTLASEEKIYFEDDFSTEGMYWTLANSNMKVIDEKLVFPANSVQTLHLMSDKFFWYEYDFEFDVNIAEYDETNDCWFGFRLGGSTHFLRIKNSTLFFSQSGEQKVGTANIVPGNDYRFKVSVRDGYFAYYYKKVSDSDYKEIGVATTTLKPGAKIDLLTRATSAVFDNIKITSATKNVILADKVVSLGVGKNYKIEASGPKSEGLKFESQNPAVATVDDNGNVEAIKNGTAIINLIDNSGEVVEMVFVKVNIELTSITFDYNPLRNGNILPDDPRYDKEKIILEVGERCDLKATLNPSSATLKALQWSVDKEGIVELYGKSPKEPAKAVTALKEGEVTITVNSKYSPARASIVVKVVPEGTYKDYESGSTRFALNGVTEPINPYFLGTHFDAYDMSGFQPNGEVATDKLDIAQEIGFKSVRATLKNTTKFLNSDDKIEFVKTYYSKPSEAHIPYVACLGYGYTKEEIVEQVKAIREVCSDTLYLELYNETYAMAYEKYFPTAEAYVEWCKELVDMIRAIDDNVVFIACPHAYPGYTDIVYDPNNFVQTAEGDMAYTQGTRVQSWNEIVKELVVEGYATGIAPHVYNGISQNWNGLTAKNFIKGMVATSAFDYYGVLIDDRKYEYMAEAYATEWGQLDGMMYWGTSDPDEQIRYNYQKYPISAILDMEKAMYFLKSGAVAMTFHHKFTGGDGFGSIEYTGETSLDQPLPKAMMFMKLADVLEQNNTYYDLSPYNQKYVDMFRPWWNGFDDESLQLSYVESFGFGDENKINQVAFFNHTDVPQTVSVEGALLTPNWQYGGEVDDIMIDWLQNKSYPSYANKTALLADADMYFKKPVTEFDIKEATELVIPPYTIMFADVSGSPVIETEFSSGKISKEAEYMFKNSLALKVGDPAAYRDNLKVNIDENPAVIPVVKNGRTLLPLRFVAESFGMDVTYDDATQEITMKDENTEIHLTVGSADYTVNGTPMQFDVPAEVSDGRTLVPLRALADAIGKDVLWDDAGYILIYSDGYSFRQNEDYYRGELKKLW